jgi:hypothetical protein
VKERAFERTPPLLVTDVLQSADGELLAFVFERYGRDLQIQGVPGVLDGDPALLDVRVPALGGEDRLYRTTGLAELGRAATAFGLPCVDAVEGLARPIAEQIECRLHAQEAESRVVGEDDLPLFVQEHQDIRNRTEDLAEQRDVRKQPV